MIIWCKLHRGKQVFAFGLLSWPIYLNQSVRFLTPIELSNFLFDTKMIKKQVPTLKCRETLT